MGFEDDNYTVTPIVAAAKRSLLRVLPYILPADSRPPTLYRLVLEHGDFGIHNMSITFDDDQNPLVTSLYDWEAGNIVPAILSDPMMSLYVDLIEDNNFASSVSREDEFATPKEHAEHMRCARVYFKVNALSPPPFFFLFSFFFSINEQRKGINFFILPPQALYEQEPSYRRVIQVGRDARYLWFALQGWLAEQPDEYFGSLGAWAERKLKLRRELNRGSSARPCPKCGFWKKKRKKEKKKPCFAKSFLSNNDDLCTSEFPKIIVSIRNLESWWWDTFHIIGSLRGFQKKKKKKNFMFSQTPLFFFFFFGCGVVLVGFLRTAPPVYIITCTFSTLAKSYDMSVCQRKRRTNIFGGDVLFFVYFIFLHGAEKKSPSSK